MIRGEQTVQSDERWQELLGSDRSVTMCADRAEAERIYVMPLKFRALAVSVNIALRDWWAYSPQEADRAAR